MRASSSGQQLLETDQGMWSFHNQSLANSDWWLLCQISFRDGRLSQHALSSWLTEGRQIPKDLRRLLDHDGWWKRPRWSRLAVPSHHSKKYIPGGFCATVPLMAVERKVSEWWTGLSSWTETCLFQVDEVSGTPWWNYQLWAFDQRLLLSTLLGSSLPRLPLEEHSNILDIRPGHIKHVQNSTSRRISVWERIIVHEYVSHHGCSVDRNKIHGEDSPNEVFILFFFSLGFVHEPG